MYGPYQGEDSLVLSYVQWSFLVLNPRCSKPDCALVGYDTSEGIANIAVLGKWFYYALPRAALSQDYDAQTLLLRKTSILVAT